MEDITNYSFTGSDGKKINVIVRFGDNNVIWYYNGMPEQIKDATIVQERFAARPYEKLFIANQHILDFLNTRLGG